MRNQGHSQLFTFKADDGAGAGEGAKGEGGKGESTATETETEKKFTQADLERFLGERLGKDREQRGVAITENGLKELRAKAKRLDELEESSKSDLEKAVARAEAAEKEKQDAIDDAKEVRLRAAILSEAAKPDRKVVDTEAVISLLNRSDLTLDEQGVPTNIAEAMDSLLKAKPFLVSTGGHGSADQGAREGGGVKQLTRADLQNMTADEIVKARREGRTATIEGRT